MALSTVSSMRWSISVTVLLYVACGSMSSNAEGSPVGSEKVACVATVSHFPGANRSWVTWAAPAAPVRGRLEAGKSDLS